MVALLTDGVIDPPRVTVEVVVAVHPLADVPVTVYVAVAVLLQTTLAPVVELNPAAGLHVYVEAPLAVRVEVAPGHIVAELTEITGLGTTVIVPTADAVHEELVPITV